MFDKLTDEDQERIQELQLTALGPLSVHPVPGLVRAFAWLEARRTEKNWPLYELGLLMLRGRALAHPTLGGLAAELLAEAKRRESPWLQVLNEPLLPRASLSGTVSPGHLKDRWPHEFRDQLAAFLRGFDAGAEFHLIPVIAFPGGRKKRPVVTVWGFKAGRARWPSAAETKVRRRDVETARQARRRT